MEYGIYHDKDNDGLACGAIMRRAFPNIKLIGWDYGYQHAELLEQIPAGAKVVMADLSLPFAEMKELANKCQLTWIDHHKSVWYDLKDLPYDDIFFDTDKAACQLCWEYFFPNQELPQTIDYLAAYDIFDKRENWESVILPFQYYFKSEMSIAEIEKALREENAYPNSFVGKTVVKGRAIINYIDKSLQYYLSEKYITQYKDNTFYIINATLDVSRFGELVFQKYPEVDALFIWRQKTATTRSVACRSRDHFDVGEFARARGGGGHQNAAGFRIITDEFTPFKL